VRRHAALVLGFMFLFLVLPLAAVFTEALRKGWDGLLGGVEGARCLVGHPPDADRTAAIAVPLNLVFGVAAAWCIAKYEFKGKSF
jgi:sulfate/thiosulfate transport system permease protein